jgi:hypothetical protein
MLVDRGRPRFANRTTAVPPSTFRSMKEEPGAISCGKSHSGFECNEARSSYDDTNTRRSSMSTLKHLRTALAATAAAVAAGTAIVAPATAGGPEEVSPIVKTLKPISGQGAGPDQHFLFSVTLGTKQAVSYFQNEHGLCKLTLMVADAFNGEDVPNLTTVRFEAAIDPAKSARFDTAEGKALEFTCEADAQAMKVRALDQVAIWAPTTWQTN